MFNATITAIASTLLWVPGIIHKIKEIIKALESGIKGVITVVALIACHKSFKYDYCHWFGVNQIRHKPWWRTYYRFDFSDNYSNYSGNGVTNRRLPVVLIV